MVETNPFQAISDCRVKSPWLSARLKELAEKSQSWLNE